MRLRSLLIHAAITLTVCVPSILWQRPLDADGARQIMQEFHWGDCYAATPHVLRGGIDPREDGGKPWGDPGIFYVGVYRAHSGMSWFGKGPTIEEALYDAVAGGYLPMQRTRVDDDGYSIYDPDYAAEASFLRSIGRSPIQRCR